VDGHGFVKVTAFKTVRKCFEMNPASAAEGCFRLEPALFPQPVKPDLFSIIYGTRLKSCPDTKQSFSAACEARTVH
jgi:hypothetical protein